MKAAGIDVEYSISLPPVPRPLHKSLSFWSGVLVLIALVAAWIDSHKHETYFSYLPSGARTCYIASFSEGKLWIRSDSHPYGTAGLHFYHGPPYEPPELISSIGSSYPGSGLFPVTSSAPEPPTPGIPLWTFLPAHLALWSALLYYRHRRIKGGTTPPSGAL